MKLIKNFRFLILVVLFLVSVYFILSSFFFQRGGVVVVSLTPESKCNNIYEGIRISEIKDRKIASLDDFETEVKKVKAGEYVSMKANGMPAGCFAIRDGDIGLEVEELRREGLKFSDEIVDVKVDVFKVKNITSQELENVSKILKIRLEKLRLPQTKIFLTDFLIKIVNLQRTQDLFARCKFEIKISHQFDIENGTGFIEIGNNSYEIRFYNESFEVNNSLYSLNESFSLEGIEFNLLNVTNSSAIFYAKVVGNEDAAKVLSHLAFIRFDETSKNYILNLPLEISLEAQEKIKKILKNVGAFFIGENVFLKANFLYFLDEKLLSTIPISRNFRREASLIPIIAFEKNFNEISDLKKSLDSCLNSGVLKYDIKKVGSEIQKAKFTNLAKVLILISIVAAFIPTINFWKKIGIYSLLFSTFLIFEIFIFFGLAGLTQLIFSPGWIIDLATFIGILTVTIFAVISILFKLTKLKEYLLLAFGFVILFTPFKGLGLVIIFWMAIHKFFVIPLLKDFL